MNELIMRRHSYRWNMLTAVALAWFYLWSGADQLLSAAGTTAVPEEAQKAFDKKQYEQVLEQLGKLVQEQGAAPDVRRLKIRSKLPGRWRHGQDGHGSARWQQDQSSDPDEGRTDERGRA